MFRTDREVHNESHHSHNKIKNRKGDLILVAGFVVLAPRADASAPSW